MLRALQSGQTYRKTTSLAGLGLNGNFTAVLVRHLFDQVETRAVALSLGTDPTLKDMIQNLVAHPAAAVLATDHVDTGLRKDAQVNLAVLLAALLEFFDGIFQQVADHSHILPGLHQKIPLHQTAAGL